jgi:hypothetical protein
MLGLGIDENGRSATPQFYKDWLNLGLDHLSTSIIALRPAFWGVLSPVEQRLYAFDTGLHGVFDDTGGSKTPTRP